MLLKLRKVIATILVIAMTITSAGFNTLAGSIDSTIKMAEENNNKGVNDLSIGESEELDSTKVIVQNDDATNEDNDGLSEQGDGNIEAKNNDGADKIKTTSDGSFRV